MASTIIKLQIQGGSATPGPPVGTALGSKGVSTRDFCLQFNALTQNQKGKLLRVLVVVKPDRKFDILIKGSPSSAFIKEAAKIEKGASSPKRETAGTVTEEALLKIAQEMGEGIQGFTEEARCNVLKGTARSMGIQVVK